MYRSGGIDLNQRSDRISSFGEKGTHLGVQCTGFICALLALEDMEVIIGGVNSGVSFRPNGRAKDDQVPASPHSLAIPLAKSKILKLTR